MTSPIKPIKKLNRPEAAVQAKIVRYLQMKGWYVKETHGNYFQSGFPDLHAVHQSHGSRWIEVKDPNRKGRSSLFTPAQLETFHAWAARGLGVWVLTDIDDVSYNILFRSPNWTTFL